MTELRFIGLKFEPSDIHCEFHKTMLAEPDRGGYDYSCYLLLHLSFYLDSHYMPYQMILFSNHQNLDRSRMIYNK